MKQPLHTIDLLEKALEKVAKCNVEVKLVWLDGLPAGLCRIGNRKCLYLDQSQTAAEQLETVMTALASITNRAA